MTTIVLASQSPRRKALLGQYIPDLEIEVSSYEEDLKVDEDPYVEVLNAALGKALAVAKNRPEGDLVIGSDTIVYLDRILGKPKDLAEARQMLTSLSGKKHRVITAYAICRAHQERTITGFSEVMVTFEDLSQEEIEWYLRTKEPLDKAGAYGIQGLGGIFVKEIEGDFYAVVGLPIAKIHKELKAHFGLGLL